MSLQFNIRIAKHRRTFIAIDHFEFPEQKVTFLFGESGIGKSILSKAIYGLLNPLRLDIHINGDSYPDYLRSARTQKFREAGFFVFQEPSSHLNPLIRLQAQLREGSLADAPGEQEILRHLWNHAPEQEIRKLLEVYPKPHRPSGGEKQRFLLAMAFKKLLRMQQEGRAQEGLYVFDEPSGSLDNHFRNRFLEMLFQRFRKGPFSAIFITHDYSIISEIYSRHADLREQIAFKELSRQDDRLVLQDFAPRAYLDWLKLEQSMETPPGDRRKPLLTMKGGYEIFGKKMIFRRNREEKGPDPGMLQIHRGEIVYLKAASGVGKTTLAKIIMGLQPCRRLEMRIGELAFSENTPRRVWQQQVWAKKIGMVFQHADEALNLNSTVQAVFAGLPIQPPLTPASIVQLLNELFEGTIEPAFLNQKVSLLSGGQKQRLNLLRTLALDTDLVLLDEPLNGLDFLSIQRVIAALKEKQQEGKAILMISHNEEIFEAVIPVENSYYLDFAGRV